MGIGHRQTWSLLTPTRGAFAISRKYLHGAAAGHELPGGLGLRAGSPEFVSSITPRIGGRSARRLENPQQFVPSSVVFPTDGATNFFSTQFDNGSSSTSATSAAVNPTVPNLHPDIIAKTALRLEARRKAVPRGCRRRGPKFQGLRQSGHRRHATNTITGGGGGVNVNFEVLKDFHLIGNSFYGDGVGRYIGGLGPDVIVKPNGTLSAVHCGFRRCRIRVAGHSETHRRRLLQRRLFLAQLRSDHERARHALLSGYVLRRFRIPGLGEHEQPGLPGSHRRFHSDDLVEPELRKAAIHLAVFLRGSHAVVRARPAARRTRTRSSATSTSATSFRSGRHEKIGTRSRDRRRNGRSRTA